MQFSQWKWNKEQPWDILNKHVILNNNTTNAHSMNTKTKGKQQLSSTQCYAKKKIENAYKCL